MESLLISIVTWAIDKLTNPVSQLIKGFSKIRFHEEQRDWEFNDSYDFWRSFQGPQHWSSTKIREIPYGKDKIFTKKITLHMHFSNFLPTIPGWNAYKDFDSPWIHESVGHGSVNSISIMPVLGYSMVRPPVLIKKEPYPSKKEYLYLSAFRRIVPDGIPVYFGPKVVNDGKFQKVIDILNEYGAVDMKLRGTPEKVRKLFDHSDRFIELFKSKLKDKGIAIPTFDWGRIRVDSPDDIIWDTISKSGKLEGSGAVWNAVGLHDETLFFHKNIHLGVKYYNLMLIEAAESIEREILKCGDYSPLFAIDAYSRIFDNAKVIPWKPNDIYDQDFMINKDSLLDAKKMINGFDINGEFILAQHMSYIKGFKKKIQLCIDEAVEYQKKKDYQKAKYLIDEALNLINMGYKGIENENLLFNQLVTFKSVRMVTIQPIGYEYRNSLLSQVFLSNIFPIYPGSIA